MEAVIAAGGAVFRSPVEGQEFEVLLIFRRGVWDLPKGKMEEGESVEQCALREVAEETGVTASLEITASLGTTYHEYRQDETNYSKTTYWYAMRFSKSSEVSFNPQAEEDIEQVKWLSISEAKKRAGYKNLVNILERLEKQS